MISSKINLIDEFFQQAPASINVPVIREAWLALDGAYNLENWQLPWPLWARRAYDDRGNHAWKILQQELTEPKPERPLCIYIHIPFCTSKCGFCDSYSFKLGNHVQEHIENYVRHLCDELELWSQSCDLGQRLVSTIHLGGGTPAFIGEMALAQLVECFHRFFAVNNKTELALETTVESLSPDMIANLHALGFRRLHVGVQSMQDEVRSMIGRRCSSVDVLRSIEATLDLDWIVSVDLLCGLPNQTLAGFIEGIESLISAGANGFSLYELLIRKQNFRWASQHNLTNRSHFHNYLMMQAGACILERSGFRKNMFNHWADEQDENIYFTFPTRGEDCLAIGTIADGVFGDYHYRHPRYADYSRANHSLSPGLEGGMKRNQLENWLHPIETALLSGYIDPKTMKVLDKFTHEGTSVINKWLAHAMIEIDSGGWARLTTNGTWFAGNLVAELRECLEQG